MSRGGGTGFFPLDVVLCMGRDAAPFMKQLQAPPNDGDVLEIETDGSCTPRSPLVRPRRCGRWLIAFTPKEIRG